MCWLIMPLSLPLGLRTLASAAGGGAWGWGARRLGTGRTHLDLSEEQEKLRPTLVWPWWGALGCGPRPAQARSLGPGAQAVPWSLPGWGFTQDLRTLLLRESALWFSVCGFLCGTSAPELRRVYSLHQAVMFQCSDLAPAAWGVRVTWNSKDLIVRPVPSEHNGFVTSRFFFFACWSM